VLGKAGAEKSHRGYFRVPRVPRVPQPQVAAGGKQCPLRLFGDVKLESSQLHQPHRQVLGYVFGAGGLEVVEFLEFLGRFILVAAGLPTSSYDYQLIVSEAAV